MLLSCGDFAEHDAVVGEVEPEAVPPEQIPADDAIHRGTAGAQVAQILDGDLYVGGVIRPKYQFGQDAPLDPHGLVEIDHLAGASSQIEAFGEIAVNGAGGGTGIEQEI